MKKWLAVGIVVITAITGTITAIKINFPPTGEQLGILNGLKVNGMLNLWVLRVITLMMLGSVLYSWRIIVEKVDESLKDWSCLIILTTPVFLVLAMVHPIIAFKLGLMVILIYLGQRYLRNKLVIVWGTLAVVTILINVFILGNKPAIFNKLSFKDAQVELVTRITNEDSLNPKMVVPLWWRRIAYNKYFFVYKEVTAEALPFFDLESLFLQEVHPMEQKSVVMFYWIEIYLLVLGVYFIVRSKNFRLKRLILMGIMLAWVNYIFSEGEVYLRLIYMIFPLSIIIAQGWESLMVSAKNKYVLAKIFCPIVGVVILYGMQINYLDMTVRTQKWFDNRPLAFQFWFENLKKIDYSRYDRVQISSLVGEAKAYCYFYLGDTCNQDKYVFKSFDLSQEKAVPKSIYAGFAGEFVGPRFKNDIVNNWEQETQDKGFEFVGVETLMDTIAYKYGNDIGLAIKK
jgi:hypothetical protein